MKRLAFLVVLMGCGDSDPQVAEDWLALEGTYRVGEQIDCYVQLDGQTLKSNNGSGESLCVTRDVAGRSSIERERELTGTLTNDRVEARAHETLLKVAGDCTTRTKIEIEGAAEKHRDREGLSGAFAGVAGPWTGRLEIKEEHHQVCDGQEPVDLSETYAIVFEVELKGAAGKITYRRAGTEKAQPVITIETDSEGLYRILDNPVYLLQ